MSVLNNGSVSRYDNHMSSFAFRIISLMQQTLGKFDQKSFADNPFLQIFRNPYKFLEDRRGYLYLQRNKERVEQSVS